MPHRLEQPRLSSPATKIGSAKPRERAERSSLGPGFRKKLETPALGVPREARRPLGLSPAVG
eukprot:7968988-Alexandrium_andersonii.AAC.1